MDQNWTTSNCEGSTISDDDNQSHCLSEEESEEEEEEEKINVKTDPCLICGQPAVFYSAEGDIIKRELNGDFSSDNLFSNLCLCLGLKTKRRGRGGENERKLWNFDNSFPFCEKCEFLLAEVSALYEKLKEMEETFKDKILQAEDIYSEDQLYIKHPEGYANFRNQVLKGSEFNSVGYQLKITSEQQQYKSIMKKARKYLEARRRRLSSLSSENHELNAVEMKTEERPEIDEGVTSQKQISDFRIVSSKKPNRKPVKLSSWTNRTTLNPPKDELFIGTKMNPKYNAVRDPVTGNITYRTGIGGTSCESKRTTLLFKMLAKDKGYKCSSCSKVVPFMSAVLRIQRQHFRQHFLAFHTNRFKCKFCNEPESLSFRNKHILLHHLKEEHNIPSLYAMNFKHRNMKLAKITKPVQSRKNTPTSEQIVLCSFCGMKFTSGPKLKLHISKVHSGSPPVKPLKCKFSSCLDQFENEDILRRHVKEHVKINKDIKSCICKHCGKTFSAKINCKEHVSMVHLKIKNEKCSFCDAKFYMKSNMKKHMAVVHHQGEYFGEFKCQVEDCDKVFTSKAYLSTHCRQVNHILPDRKRAAKSPNVRKTSIPRKKSKISKSKCSRKSTSESSDSSDHSPPVTNKKRGRKLTKPERSWNVLMSTEETENGERRTFRRENGLGLGHSVTKDVKTGNIIYETGTGNRYGMYRATFLFENVQGQDLFKCSVCSRTVAKVRQDRPQTRKFREHFLTFHSGKRNIMGDKSKCCEICGMPFTDFRSGDYIYHRRSHLSEEEKIQERRHRGGGGGFWMENENRTGTMCETCGKVLSSKHTLYGHMRTHLPNEEKPFPCHLCKFKFTTKLGLQVHLKRVHPDGNVKKKYSCKFTSCLESYDNEQDLQQHVTFLHATSLEAEGLMCFQCGKTFTTSQALKLHGLTHTLERPHVCCMCSKTFPLKDTLLRHMAGVHRQGEQFGVFKCEVENCGIVFPCDKYRKVHMRTKHKIYCRKKK